MKKKFYTKSLVLLILCIVFTSCENYVEDEHEMLNQDCNPATSYVNEIKLIIDTNCISCHNGNQFPDLRTYLGVSTNSAIVMEQVFK